ncbi:MAG: oxidoreductase [Pseudomonadota bacterium]
MVHRFTADDVPDQTGRTFVVTGANTGIGFEAAKVLATRGGRVLLACRSQAKADAACGAIRQVTPDADVEVVLLDLGDLASIRAAAETIAREPRLDALINNAGLMMPPREMTADGFESQFGVNHLGTFALTGLLFERLCQEDGAPRIVITSSNAHKAGTIHFRDPNAEQKYSRWDRYAMSKLANLLHAQELARRIAARGLKVRAIACHPGASATELGRHMPGPLAMLFPLAGPLLNSASQGAWSTLAAATAPDAANGDYLGPQDRMEWAGPVGAASMSNRARDEKLAERLWALSDKMTGMMYPGL